jgi:hypothetical protein
MAGIFLTSSFLVHSLGSILIDEYFCRDARVGDRDLVFFGANMKMG